MKDSDIFKYEEDETDPHFCLVNSVGDIIFLFFNVICM